MNYNFFLKSFKRALVVTLRSCYANKNYADLEITDLSSTNLRLGYVLSSLMSNYLMRVGPPLKMFCRRPLPTSEFRSE